MFLLVPSWVVPDKRPLNSVCVCVCARARARVCVRVSKAESASIVCVHFLHVCFAGI